MKTWIGGGDPLFHPSWNDSTPQSAARVPGHAYIPIPLLLVAVLTAACSDLPTEPPPADSLAGANLSLAPENGSVAFVTRLKSGRCVTVQRASREAGTPLILKKCAGTGDQQFTVERSGAIRIYGDRCVDATGGHGKNGDRVVIRSCHGRANQKWSIDARGQVRGIGGKCLDVARSADVEGAKLIIWRCHGGDNQRWRVRGDAKVGKAKPSPAPPTIKRSPPPPQNGNTGVELPRTYLDTRYVAPRGKRIDVPPGGDLQGALNAAEAGDEIVLRAEATYTGNFVLPAKRGSAWIVIRSSGVLPSEGTRVSPADRGSFARLVSPKGSAALSTKPGARHYRIMGLEITYAPQVRDGNALVSLGNGERAQKKGEETPGDLILDRVYVHGHPGVSFQRCIAVNTPSTAIIDSFVAECHGKPFDSQAIASWDSDGPVKIVNNYLEGAGENIIFGGSGTSLQGRIASDLEIRRNHFHKPLSWKGVWLVKNLFELKNAQRVLFEGNVLDGNWNDGQNGFAVVLTPRSQNGSTPWAVVRDVTFRWNVIRNSAGGVNILARDDNHPSGRAERIAITDNSFEGIGREERYGDIGRAVQVLKNVADLTIARNTIDARHTGLILEAAGDPIKRLRYEDNLVGPTQWGIFGRSTGEKPSTWSTHTAGDYVFRGNVLVGRESNRYPNAAQNAFPTSLAAYGGSAGVDKARLSHETKNVVQR